MVLLACGCSRTHYRNRADREVYGIERQREVDPRWALPRRPVEAAPNSRIGDPFDPDHEPIPVDDPAARQFQFTAGRKHEFHGWAKRGFADVENARWLACLSTDSDGAVVLGRESAMRLALLNSREYQTAVEDVYLSALSLTLARFDFYLQPFSRQRLGFNHFGAPSNDSNQLQINSDVGFSQNFYSGGQLLVDLANTLVFEFSGKGFYRYSSNLAVTLTQPLLRGAFARIRTQFLSQQERNVLYAVRTFARFRRIFYVNVESGQGGYLSLLLQLQNIRNAEQNLRITRRNLEEYEELVRAGQVSLSERDQVAQTFQQSQSTLLAQQAGLETSLDVYKIVLGLPPELKTKVDDAPLKEFELTDPRLEDLRRRNEALNLSLLQPEAVPARSELIAALRNLRSQFTDLQGITSAVDGELQAWRKRLGLPEKPAESEAEGGDLPAALPETAASGAADADAQQVALVKRLTKDLSETRRGLAADAADVDKLVGTFEAMTGEAVPPDDWRDLRSLVNKALRGRLADVVAVQTQVRAFAIELPALDLSVDDALDIALANREDLMNLRAQVTDAWRNEEVAANRLLADLSVVYNGNLRTDPDHPHDLYRFDASASNHQVALQFDAPLVRRAERNAYRSTQVAYQRARRAWIAQRDDIVRQVRLDMRNLELARRQFEINRQQVITAARQVELNDYNLRNARERNAGQTVLLLNGLSQLLGAQNNLIQTWVNYQTTRMGLYRDLDILTIDSLGAWTNESYEPVLAARSRGRRPAGAGADPSGGVDPSGASGRLATDPRPEDAPLPPVPAPAAP